VLGEMLTAGGQFRISDQPVWYTTMPVLRMGLLFPLVCYALN